MIHRHMILREMAWRESYNTLNNMADDLMLSVDLRNKLCEQLSRAGAVWVERVPYECLLIEVDSPGMTFGVHVTKFNKPGPEVRDALNRLAMGTVVLL